MELPTRSIEIGEQEHSSLQKNVWSEKYVSAFMVVQGKREPVKLRYRGGHTRDYPKKSYEVVRGGKTYHYNAEYDDPSMLRNALSFRFFEWIGVPSPRTRHCLLSLNGQSLGVYLEIEGVDRHFFERRGIAVQALFYAVNDFANFKLSNPESRQPKSSLFRGYELKMGSESDRIRWKSFILKLNTLKGKQLSRYLKQRVDIDNYVKWLAGAVCTGNYDGFDQNYAVYLHRSKRRYRIIPWDYEGTWGRNCYGKKCSSRLVRVQGYNQLTRKLLSFPSVRAQYKAVLRSVLKRHFTVRNIAPVVLQMHEQIAPHIYRDSTRKWSHGVFDGEPELIRNYIKERRKIILESLKKL
ncbi:CotH kinase family protein [Paenibacillus doosanensis]|uniref:CotH kinase family protein n=1 Tax=Paenibacillus doosanensis TaxID=1229154 RepID=UPI00217FB0AA|nr:CotH kinase family protein [Paenibacillus doosanensis]MCS7462613.1 CotH kinase family protein [Paenibacillus doosanensis]